MSVVNLGDMATDPAEVVADICIVGAGPAGLVAAVGLAKRGKRVVVLESGPIGDSGWSDDLNAVDTEALTYKGAAVGRRRDLGGTSQLWGGRLIPLTDHDLAERDYLGLQKWPIDGAEIYRYAPAVEALFKLRGGATSYESLQQAGVGIRELIRSSDEIVSRSPKIVSFGQRNVYTLLASEVRASGNITIYSSATTTAIEIDAATGRANRIIASGMHGRTIRVRADRIVLAAGTLESTRQLLLIDRVSDGRVFAGMARPGEHFVDHLAMDVGPAPRFKAQMIAYLLGHSTPGGMRRVAHFELAPAVQREAGIGSAYLCLRLHTDSGQIEQARHYLRDLRMPDRGHQKLPLGSIVPVTQALLWRTFHGERLLPHFMHVSAEIRIEQAPADANRLSLSNQTDRLGVARIKLDWALGGADIRTFSTAYSRFIKFWDQRGLLQACGIQWRKTEDYADALTRGVIRDVHHPSGSTRMGSDPKNSVVDSDLACHAVRNISVLSPSVFPSAGSANPMLTLLCLAFRLAETLGSAG